MGTKSATEATQAPAPPKQKVELEIVAALAGTVLVAASLFLAMIYAGPLWRDETNTINLAVMPLKELWRNLPFESFPPLWLLLVRAWGFLGMAGTDAGIRVLAFIVGLFFLGSLWICVRWVGGRAPTLSLALLGSLPAFVFTVSSNRAYGLAMCFLVLTFGAIWRLVESPSRSRLLAAALTSLLFVHCVYYDIIFLCAILLGATAVLVRRRNWKTLLGLAGIGVGACASLLIYIPIIQSGSAYTRIVQIPFSLPILWMKLKDALSLRNSAQPPGTQDSAIWLWGALILIAMGVATVLQRRSVRIPCQQRVPAAPAGRPAGADLALFSILSLLCGSLGYAAFLFKLQFPTQAWYYMGAITLGAISLEAVLNVNWPGRGLGVLRTAFLLAMVLWGGRSVWQEAHTRRSNVDLVAAILNEKATEGDLIVVHFAFEGITFDRYYRGHAKWMTIPPIDSHKVHRNDLIRQRMYQTNTMARVLAEATTALRNGKNVWVLGRVPSVDLAHLPASPATPDEHPGWYLEQFGRYWGSQLSAHLLKYAAQAHTFATTLDVPVNFYEDLPLAQFSGLKPD